MGGDPDKLASGSEPVERSLIDAAWAQFETLAARHRPSLSDGRRSLAIPGYRVLREIHRGGQGVVYQAVQESTHRKVAVKVLKEGPFADPTELARFDREVDVLSRLNHPHIVAIHDRGLTAGHAYYVMDYIPGRPLDAHVAGAGLPTREVLDLFRKVCEAVNIAHLRGVIHRDLKPSNIRVDDEGEPRILDFGLAKMAPESSWSADDMTITGQFIGSLPWASPEQAEGRSELLDVRTDVYSLGVILYQLLTGSFPYPVSGRMNEVVQHILHTSPARPSTLARHLDRDIEVILLKCLAKDPERRYQSAGELARDVQRYLKGEPIEARPATSLYQLRQFARRNKPLVASVITIMLILAAATAVSLVFAAQARRETGRATREAARADQARREAEQRQKETQQVADFQSNMLREIDVEAMGRGIKEGFREQVRSAIGRQYVGEYPNRRKRSEEEVDAELAIYNERADWAQPADVARRVIDEYVLKQAGQALEKEFANQPLVQADILRAIGTNYQALGLYGKAEPYLRQALELRRGVLGPEHEAVAQSLNNLASLLKDSGDYAAAEPLYRESLAMYRKLRGDEHPNVADCLDSLAKLLNDKGEHAAAEPLYREALAMRRRLLGDEHLGVALSLNNWALLLTDRGDFTAAEPLFRESLATYRKLLGDENRHVAASLNNLARLLGEMGDHAAAEPLFREALAMRHRLLGDEHWLTLNTASNLGGLLRAMGRPKEAIALLAPLEPADRRTFTGGNALRLGRFLTRLGRSRADTGDFELAEANLIEAHAIVVEAKGATAQDRGEVLAGLVELYEAWHAAEPDKGYDAKAAQWRAELADRHAIPAQIEPSPRSAGPSWGSPSG